MKRDLSKRMLSSRMVLILPDGAVHVRGTEQQSWYFSLSKAMITSGLLLLWPTTKSSKCTGARSRFRPEVVCKRLPLPTVPHSLLKGQTPGPRLGPEACRNRILRRRGNLQEWCRFGREHTSHLARPGSRPQTGIEVRARVRVRAKHYCVELLAKTFANSSEDEASRRTRARVPSEL